MEELIRPNSSKDSLKNYITRFSSIFAIYGYIAFAVGILCYFLPIIGGLAIGVYFLLILFYTLLVFIITLGVGFVLVIDSIKTLWATFENTAELYKKFSEISIKISPIISGVSISLLLSSLILYIIFSHRRQVKSIILRSIFLALASLLLVFSLSIILNIGV